jgi:hypothetical protein
MLNEAVEVVIGGDVAKLFFRLGNFGFVVITNGNDLAVVQKNTVEMGIATAEAENTDFDLSHGKYRSFPWVAFIIAKRIVRENG